MVAFHGDAHGNGSFYVFHEIGSGGGGHESGIFYVSYLYCLKKKMKKKKILMIAIFNGKSENLLFSLSRITCNFLVILC